MVEQQVGKEVGTKLAKYMGVVSLTKPQAKEILEAVFPEAPASEITRAMILCANYGLNPLMNHLFRIPFWNAAKGRNDYVCVRGITTSRLIASRTHSWSFTDETPRIGTEKEIITHFGTADKNRVRAIAKIKDLKTVANVTAWGE